MTTNRITRPLMLLAIFSGSMGLAGCEPWSGINNNTDDELEIGYASPLARCHEVSGMVPAHIDVSVHCKITDLSEIYYRSSTRQCRAGPMSISKAVRYEDRDSYGVRSQFLNITDLPCDNAVSVPAKPTPKSRVSP